MNADFKNLVQKIDQLEEEKVQLELEWCKFEEARIKIEDQKIRVQKTKKIMDIKKDRQLSAEISACEAELDDNKKRPARLHSATLGGIGSTTQQEFSTVFRDRQEPQTIKLEKIIVVPQLKAAMFVKREDRRIELEGIIGAKSENKGKEINSVSGKGANGPKSNIIGGASNVISLIGKSANTFRGGTLVPISNPNHYLLEKHVRHK